MSPAESRQSPLHEVHLALGAKLVPFGGWEMPLSYPTGTIDEHMACRNGAVVFDVSHLGTVRVTGTDAVGALQNAFTNDLHRITPGRAQYTHLLDPSDGSVLDDIIVWWVAEGRFDVMPNASNTDRVTTALVEGPGSPTIADVTDTRAVMAIQGPEARACIATIWPEAAAVERFHVAQVQLSDDVSAVVAGTGYTGEDGIEIAVANDDAVWSWEQIVGTGVIPAGLGARDTLRLEAGLPLHGHELGPGITPLQAGLSWVVRFGKGDFRGKAALLEEKEAGVRRRLRGLLLEGRRPPRDGQSVLVDDQTVGKITSGNFSPVLERGIGLALLDPSIEIGDQVVIDVRGTPLPATVVETPFVGRH